MCPHTHMWNNCCGRCVEAQIKLTKCPQVRIYCGDCLDGMSLILPLWTNVSTCVFASCLHYDRLQKINCGGVPTQGYYVIVVFGDGGRKLLQPIENTCSVL